MPLLANIVECNNARVTDAIVPNRRYNNTSDLPIIQKGHCYWCNKKLEKPRRKYCSNECLESAEIMFSPQGKHSLSFLLHRQELCCIKCGVDYSALVKFIIEREKGKVNHGRVGYFLNIHAPTFNLRRLEVHHVVPVSLGGACFGLDNVIAVCDLCHRSIHKKIQR